MEDRYACTTHNLEKYKPTSASEASYNLFKSGTVQHCNTKRNPCAQIAPNKYKHQRALGHLGWHPR